MASRLCDNPSEHLDHVMSQASLTTYRAAKAVKVMLDECTSHSTKLNRVTTRTSRSPLASTMCAKERAVVDRAVVDRAVVDHTYHDHLHDPEESESSTSSGEADQRPRKKGPRGGVTVTFPEKLHIMLQACEEEGLDHVVSWLPHGRCVVIVGRSRALGRSETYPVFPKIERCFLVRQKEEFVENIMPR
jgi:hypothetical protein